MEVWKDVVGYENIYQVSSYGNVRVLNYKHSGKAQVVKQCLDHYGYPKIRLSRNGIRKDYKVHRLIAIAHLKNEDLLPEVNHKDKNRKNNNINNLEWVTKADNLKHQFETGVGTLTKPVIAVNISTGEEIEFGTIASASRYFNINRSLISHCLSGRYKTTNGYTFKTILTKGA